MTTQENVQVHFTVIETMQSTATALVSRTQFKEEIGIDFENATQEQIAEFCLVSNLEYKKTSIEERVEDPVFLTFDLERLAHKGLPAAKKINACATENILR